MAVIYTRGPANEWNIMNLQPVIQNVLLFLLYYGLTILFAGAL